MRETAPAALIRAHLAEGSGRRPCPSFAAAGNPLAGAWRRAESITSPMPSQQSRRDSYRSAGPAVALGAFAGNDGGVAMPRETWAVHSVRDHMTKYPFVVDSLLYDRVRIPVPADDDRDRWVRQEWDPERLQSFIEVLGDRARALEWDEELRKEWRSSLLAAKQSAGQTAPDAFKMTRTVLIDSLPRAVTGVDTVSAYADFDDMREDAGLTEQEPTPQPAGLVAASIAWEFAVPEELQNEPVDLQQELDVLRAAVALSNSKRYQKNRRAYWRWVREFTDGTVTGEEALTEGLAELQDLMQEQRDLARSVWIDRSVRMGLLLGTITIGMMAGPLTPVVAAGAALAVGQFGWTELWNRQQAGTVESQVGAMFCVIDDRIRKRFFEGQT